MRPFVAAPAEPAALRQRAREDGFVFLPGLLPVERLQPLRALVDRALEKRGWLVDGRTDPALRLGRWDDPRWIAFLAEIVPSEPYRTLGLSPEIAGIMRQLLEAEPAFHVGDVCRLVSPGALDLTTPPHQDAAYLADAAGVWTAWIPLGACPRELGPLSLLAGSHQQGLHPHTPVAPGRGGIAIPADAPWSSLDLQPGDVIAFSSFTVHRALPNVTADRLRVSVDYRYRPAQRL